MCEGVSFLCPKDAERAEQRVRGAGELLGTAAGDGSADVFDQARRVLVEKRNHSLQQRFVAIELIEELFAGEDGQRFRGDGGGLG